MTVDHRFIIKKLQTMPEIFTAFSQATRHPFVTCDKDSFNDQVHVFVEEAQVRTFAQSYAEQKIALAAVKVTQAQFLPFYGNLYSLGINAVVLHDKNTVTELALEEIVRKPQNPATLPKEKRPITNPELSLTALYFLQEMRRPVPQEEKHGLADLDEELVANLVRARFLTGVENDPKAPMKDGKNQVRIPFIKTDKGEMFQALFTDLSEMLKFDPQKKLRPLVVPFGELEKLLIENATGFILNPGSISLPLRKEQLPAFRKRMGL